MERGMHTGRCSRCLCRYVARRSGAVKMAYVRAHAPASRRAPRQLPLRCQQRRAQTQRAPPFAAAAALIRAMPPFSRCRRSISPPLFSISPFSVFACRYGFRRRCLMPADFAAAAAAAHCRHY